MLKSDTRHQSSPLLSASLPKLKNLSSVLAIYTAGLEDLKHEILTSGLKDEHALDFLRNPARVEKLFSRMAEDFGTDERKVRQTIQAYRKRRSNNE